MKFSKDIVIFVSWLILVKPRGAKLKSFSLKKITVNANWLIIREVIRWTFANSEKNYSSCLFVLFKFLGMKSHSKRVKILLLLEKIEKFALLNKNDRFFFRVNSHFKGKKSHFLFRMNLTSKVKSHFKKFREYI